MGIIAASMVHWLMLDETMFITAMPALLVWRAQLNAVTFSGNSDRNGATHCTKTNVLMPAATAHLWSVSMNGCTLTYRSQPPTAKMMITPSTFGTGGRRTS